MNLSARGKLWLTLLGILVLAGFALMVDIPQGPDISWGGELKRQIKVHLGLDLQGGTALLYEADLTEIPNEEKEEAMEGVRDVIERRVNAFGVSEPLVQTTKYGDTWRVNVELPGIEDVNEAVNEIGETPLLEFKEEGEPKEYTEEEKAEIEEQNIENKKLAQEVLDQALAGEDFAVLATEKSQDPGSATEGGALGEIRRGETIAEFEEVVFEKAEVGQVYPEVVETVFGYHIIKVDELRQDEEGNDVAVASHILMLKVPDEPQMLAPEYVNTGLSGKQLKGSEVVFDPQTNLPQVNLTFDDEGKDLFAEITERNVGKTVAIYLDGSPISTPVVNEPIRDGSAVITGDDTLEEAKTLAQRLNAGALPVPIELINQRNIGPTLGQESIEKSLLAGLIGLVILSLFIILYYRLPGVIAVIALFIYGLVVLAIFKLWPVTLTLAGVAGFIISIGMAVDANVLIFERMKEELRNKKPVSLAIDDGFKRAWTSIRDSNISTLITCLILAWMGTSLIQGFAITLAIGILVSMFSAIIITRTLLKIISTKSLWWYGCANVNSEDKEDV
ncbi:protein translocase subunit SecD [Patescibacteria group bacterium]|nr:protein translocase subunit SecD [Patescibacteria group bacterium]MBU1673712.1 protein translocase subunit SecD [Patescibacteria group bacterium]MBU1963058.1 protein translocase subunit SecD [Patescibacteria group bacterium]